MKTMHRICFGDSREIKEIKNEAVDLVVTSPPYPMIAMWDSVFSEQNPNIKTALDGGCGEVAFELMNQELDKVWRGVYRLLKEGGIACINIGDATRTLNGRFQLYPTHARILKSCQEIGFHVLPEILWRKPTNAPNKFMGSGMLPVCAYVTLEHEHILILRKGSKREFKSDDAKRLRRESSFFWEERNQWFSDVWFNLNGISQRLNKVEPRQRSAAYPFELAYRLINMFSIKGDTVFDPFIGTGTTTVAAMGSGRNSIGMEISSGFNEMILSKINSLPNFANGYIEKRISRHLEFIQEYAENKGPLSNKSDYYGFSCVSSNETGIFFNRLLGIKNSFENVFEVSYEETPKRELMPLVAQMFVEVTKQEKQGTLVTF